MQNKFLRFRSSFSWTNLEVKKYIGIFVRGWGSIQFVEFVDTGLY